MSIEQSPEENEELEILVEKINVFFLLSEGETEALKMTSEWKRHKQIAHELQLTESAIKERIRWAREKISKNQNFSSSYEGFYWEIKWLAEAISLIIWLHKNDILSDKILFLEWMKILTIISSENGKERAFKIKIDHIARKENWLNKKVSGSKKKWLNTQVSGSRKKFKWKVHKTITSS